MLTSDGSSPLGGGPVDDDSHFLNDNLFNGSLPQNGEPVNGSHPGQLADGLNPAFGEEPIDPGGSVKKKPREPFAHLNRRTSKDRRANDGYVFSIEDGLYDIRRFGRLPLLEEYIRRINANVWYAKDNTENAGTLVRIASVTESQAKDVLQMFKNNSNFDRDMSLIFTAEILGDPRLARVAFNEFSEEELLERFEFLVSNPTVMRVLGRHYISMPPERRTEFMNYVPFDFRDMDIIRHTYLSEPVKVEELWDLQQKLSYPHDWVSIYNVYKSFQKVGRLPHLSMELFTLNLFMNKRFMEQEPLHLVLRYLVSASLNHAQQKFNKFFDFLAKLDSILNPDQLIDCDAAYVVCVRNQRIQVPHQRAFFFSDGDSLNYRTESLLTKAENMQYLIAFSIDVDAEGGCYLITNLCHIPLLVDGVIIGTDLCRKIKISASVFLFFHDTVNPDAAVYPVVILATKSNGEHLTDVKMLVEKQIVKRKIEIETPLEDTFVKKKKKAKRSSFKESHELPPQELPPQSSMDARNNLDSTFTNSVVSFAPAKSRSVSPKKKKKNKKEKGKRVLDELKAKVSERIIVPPDYLPKRPPQKITASTPLPKCVIESLNNHLKNIDYDFSDMDERYRFKVTAEIDDRPSIFEDQKSNDLSSIQDCLSDSHIESIVYEDIMSMLNLLAISNNDDTYVNAPMDESVPGFEKYNQRLGMLPIEVQHIDATSHFQRRVKDRIVLTPRKLEAGDPLEKAFSNLDWYEAKGEDFTSFRRIDTEYACSKKVKECEAFNMVSNKYGIYKVPTQNEKKSKNKASKYFAKPNRTQFMDFEDGVLKGSLVPLTLPNISPEDCAEDFKKSVQLRLPKGNSTIVADEARRELFLVREDRDGRHKVPLSVKFCGDTEEDMIVAPDFVMLENEQQYQNGYTVPFLDCTYNAETGEITDSAGKIYYLKDGHFFEVPTEVNTLDQNGGEVYVTLPDGTQQSYYIMDSNSVDLGAQQASVGNTTYVQAPADTYVDHQEAMNAGAHQDARVYVVKQSNGGYQQTSTPLYIDAPNDQTVMYVQQSPDAPYSPAIQNAVYVQQAENSAQFHDSATNVQYSMPSYVYDDEPRLIDPYSSAPTSILSSSIPTNGSQKPVAAARRQKPRTVIQPSVQTGAYNVVSTTSNGVQQYSTMPATNAQNGMHSTTAYPASTSYNTRPLSYYALPPTTAASNTRQSKFTYNTNSLGYGATPSTTMHSNYDYSVAPKAVPQSTGPSTMSYNTGSSTVSSNPRMTGPSYIRKSVRPYYATQGSTISNARATYSNVVPRFNNRHRAGYNPPALPTIKRPPTTTSMSYGTPSGTVAPTTSSGRYYQYSGQMPRKPTPVPVSNANVSNAPTQQQHNIPPLLFKERTHSDSSEDGPVPPGQDQFDFSRYFIG